MIIIIMMYLVKSLTNFFYYFYGMSMKNIFLNQKRINYKINFHFLTKAQEYN